MTSITNAGINLLKTGYFLENEFEPHQLFRRVAEAYSENPQHLKRIEYYLNNLWFMPATPILANAGVDRGLPISCFLNKPDDSMDSILSTLNETNHLLKEGGGVCCSWSNVRSIGEKISQRGETSGIIPFIVMQDSSSRAVSQGGIRRGTSAVSLAVSHPEIREFIKLREKTGDPSRKCFIAHLAVEIPDTFMHAVEWGEDWDLIDPHTKEVKATVKARDLWSEILSTRLETTGEPYLIFIDNINRHRPPEYVKNNLYISQSNLCTEICLYTDPNSTAVCCLASLNLEKWNEWKEDKDFIYDVMLFLSNVMEKFVIQATKTNNKSLLKAVKTAVDERSVGLGVMGFHYCLQSMNIDIESPEASILNQRIFKHIHDKVNEADYILSRIKGLSNLSKKSGTSTHFTNKTAIAPTASISIICGDTSPSIDPMITNSFIRKNKSGTDEVRNRYLEKIFKLADVNTDMIWQKITNNQGSIQNLELEIPLWRQVKNVFKTAYEISPYILIDLASDRQKYIDQAQSLNLFVKPDISKKELHLIHKYAWTKGIKTLYYLRSLHIKQTDTLNDIKPVCNEEICEVCQ